MNNLGNYHNLYVRSNALLLVHVLKVLEANALKYVSLILLILYLH